MDKPIIPKFRKKLNSFFADESGAMTKQDLLNLTIGAVTLGAMIAPTDMSAACGLTHNQYYPGGHLSSGHINNLIAGHYNQAINGTPNVSPNAGHLSRAAVNSAVAAHCSHGSHGSHGSHAAY